MIPDFDTWYAQKHGGFSFEANNQRPEMSFKEAFFALSKETREYISEITQQMAGTIR